MIIFLQLFALSCVVGGILLTARKKRAAWLVYEAGGVAWITLYVMKGLYIAVLAQMIFMALNIYGWIQWGKDSCTESHRGDMEEKAMFEQKPKAPDNGKVYCKFCRHFKFMKFCVDRCYHPKNFRDSWGKPNDTMNFFPFEKNRINDCAWYEAK